MGNGKGKNLEETFWLQNLKRNPYNKRFYKEVMGEKKFFNPFREIERKWQERWEKEGVFHTPFGKVEKPRYVLVMFPYPSGRIHMGHVRNYTIGDAMARFYRMNGDTVLHPIGWDAFGLPAENAAIQHGVHPARWTQENIRTMRSQLKNLGFSYDWRREVDTSRPSYYRFEQKVFLQMWERGLAYRANSLVNWCPSCLTVLANEQVVGGKCWRCGSSVGLREMEGWFLRITAYAEELLSGLDSLPHWPEKVKVMQRNWIGKSEGARIRFPVEGSNEVVEVFTPRPDTVPGVTFLAVAFNSPLLSRLLSSEKRERVEEVRRKVERGEIPPEEKVGVDTGLVGIHPLTGEKIPIFVANFVIGEYGTGAVMGVPAHDQRDFEFAKKYGLPIKVVIHPPGGTLDPGKMDSAFTEPGIMAVGEWRGLPSEEGKERIVEKLKNLCMGEKSVSYKLRDWGISRQRYWGAPIPEVHCDDCGAVPVPYEELPVVLPEDVEFTGKGGNPLGKVPSFLFRPCPSCGKKARRETDTFDTFMESSWYFLRYLSPHEENRMVDPDLVKIWLPVHHYIGGIEHAVLHLLYARFFTKVLRDLGYISISEPFDHLLTQGMVIKEGAKMSKSLGNIVDPDEMVEKYGADTVRLFILFAAPPEKDLDWQESGVEGGHRFLLREKRLFERTLKAIREESWEEGEGRDSYKELEYFLSQVVYRVTRDLKDRYHFNTAISSLMELVNLWGKVMDTVPPRFSGERKILLSLLLTFPRLLSPFAPHIAEEEWERLKGLDPLVDLYPFVSLASWPTYDEKKWLDREIEIHVQVNGKLRSRLKVPRGLHRRIRRSLPIFRKKRLSGWWWFPINLSILS